MEFLKKAQRLPLEELMEAVRGSGAGLEAVRVFFPNPKAALLVSPEQDLWLPWGRRKTQAGEWPEGGWARMESLGKAYWARWEPHRVVLTPARWMEKDRQGHSRWFECPEGKGILALVLQGAPGTPVYVVTQTAAGAYLNDIHDRIPHVVDLAADDREGLT